MKTTYTVEEYMRLYMKEIVRLDGVPISIICNKGDLFIANFLKSFQKSLGMHVNLRQPLTLKRIDMQDVQYRLLRLCCELVY